MNVRSTSSTTRRPAGRHRTTNSRDDDGKTQQDHRDAVAAMPRLDVAGRPIDRAAPPVPFAAISQPPYGPAAGQSGCDQQRLITPFRGPAHPFARRCWSRRSGPTSRTGL